MIDTMEKLYDYVNRYGLHGRVKEGTVVISAAFSVSMNRPTVFHSGQRVESLVGWEVLAKPDVWVPLAEFDADGTAELVERFEALHNYLEAVVGWKRECERMKRDFERLHPTDRERFSLPVIPTVTAPAEAYVERERQKAWGS